MRTRRLPLVIPENDYRRLEQIARDQERDPLQQARYLLRRALADDQATPQDREAGAERES